MPDMSQEKPGHICNHPEFKRVIYSQSVVKVGAAQNASGIVPGVGSSRDTLFSFFSPSLSLVFFFPLSSSSSSLVVVSASPVWRLLTHAGEHISLLHSSALTSQR